MAKGKRRSFSPEFKAEAVKRETSGYVRWLTSARFTGGREPDVRAVSRSCRDFRARSHAGRARPDEP